MESPIGMVDLTVARSGFCNSSEIVLFNSSLCMDTGKIEAFGFPAVSNSRSNTLSSQKTMPTFPWSAMWTSPDSYKISELEKAVGADEETNGARRQ